MEIRQTSTANSAYLQSAANEPQTPVQSDEITTVAVTGVSSSVNVSADRKENDNVSISAEAYNLYSTTRVGETQEDELTSSEEDISGEKTEQAGGAAPAAASSSDTEKSDLDKLKEVLEKAQKALSEAQESLNRSMSELGSSNNEEEKMAAMLKVQVQQTAVAAAQSQVMSIYAQMLKMLKASAKAG